MTEWQPIETAPKDGTWFIAAKFPRDGANDFEVEAGRYDPMMWAEYEHIEGDIYRRVDKQILDWRGFNNLKRMTHWCALPDDPQETTK